MPPENLARYLLLPELRLLKIERADYGGVSFFARCGGGVQAGRPAHRYRLGIARVLLQAARPAAWFVKNPSRNAAIDEPSMAVIY